MDIEKRAGELSIKHACKVSPIVFIDATTSEEVVGFIKEPNRMVKLRCMDKAFTASMTASAELFDAIILREESDPRFTSEKSEDDKYYLGGVLEAFKTIEFAQNQFKKK
jgi:hypothetical protein